MSVRAKLLRISLFLISNAILAVGLYFVFDRFLLTTGEEIVKAWYYGDIVNLQEGQLLPSIAKNQNLLQNSSFIQSVVLVDVKDPERALFSLGASDGVPANLLKKATFGASPFSRSRSGFLAHMILAKLPGNGDLVLAYRISSSVLISGFLFVLGLSILFVAYLMGLTVKITNVERARRENLRADILKRLSHDLQSPLLSLSSLSLKVKKFDNELYSRFEQAVDSIRQMVSQTTKVDRQVSCRISPSLTTQISRN